MITPIKPMRTTNYTIPLPKYIEGKLKMLRRDFCLKLTPSEINHMESLKTETQVDQYARKLLNEKL